MQDFTSLDTSRSSSAPVSHPSGSRRLARRLSAFWTDPAVPLAVRVQRFGWTVVAVVVAGAVLVPMGHQRPAPVVAPIPVAIVPVPVPPPVSAVNQMFPQPDLDAKRNEILQGTQQMAADVQKKAPGSLGAMQAQSLADFIAAHCGKPGGCLKR